MTGADDAVDRGLDQRIGQLAGTGVIRWSKTRKAPPAGRFTAGWISESGARRRETGGRSAEVLDRSARSDLRARPHACLV